MCACVCRVGWGVGIWRDERKDWEVKIRWTYPVGSCVSVGTFTAKQITNKWIPVWLLSCRNLSATNIVPSYILLQARCDSQTYQKPNSLQCKMCVFYVNVNNQNQTIYGIYINKKKGQNLGSVSSNAVKHFALQEIL